MEELIKKLQEKRESREQKQKELDAIGESVVKSNVSMTDEQLKKTADIDAEIESLDREISALQKLLSNKRAQAGAQMATIAPALDVDLKEAERKDVRNLKGQYRITKVLASMAYGKSLDGLELEMHQEAELEAKNFGGMIEGRGVPSIMMHKTASVDAGTGGEFIPTDLSNEVIMPLRPRLTVEQLGVQNIVGLTGQFSISKLTNVMTAAWAGQFTDAQLQSLTTGSMTLTPKRMANQSLIGKQLLIQSTPDVENLVRAELLRGHQDLLDKTYYQGFDATIAGQQVTLPGVLTLAGANVIAIGANGGGLTRAHILAAETAIQVNDADIGDIVIVTNPKVVGFAKQVKLDTGSGMFLYKDGLIEEYKVYRSNYIPSDGTKGSGTNLSAFVMGVHSRSIIAHWGGYDLTVDPYTKAGNAQILLTTNAYHDIGHRYEKPFSLITDIDTAAAPNP